MRVILAQQVGKQALIVEMKFERIFRNWLRNGYDAPPWGGAPASRSGRRVQAADPLGMNLIIFRPI
jgi:hypothetical protein